MAGTGNYALVGSNGVGNGNLGEGKVYMYDTTTGNLVHALKIPTGFPSVFFGGAVAAAGSNVLVGAIAAGNPGAAYLFNTSGAVLHSYPAPGGDSNFGSAVALVGSNVLVVG